MQLRGTRGPPRGGWAPLPTLVAVVCSSLAMALLAANLVSRRWAWATSWAGGGGDGAAGAAWAAAALTFAPPAPCVLAGRCANATAGSRGARGAAVLDLEINPEWEQAQGFAGIGGSAQDNFGGAFGGGGGLITAAGGAPAPPNAQDRTSAFLSGDFLMVTFGNAAYFELMSNWVRTVEPLGLPYIIAAFDDETVALCNLNNMPNTHVNFGNSTFFRGDFRAFREMGAVKVRPKRRWALHRRPPAH